MSNLYQEAIADARALREMAERNAKNKIIEAMTPKIRKLIERQIMLEAGEEMEDETGDEIPNLDLDALPDEPAMNSAMLSPAIPSPIQGSTMPDPDEEVTHTVTTKTASGTEVKINVRVDKHGEASATAETEEAEGDDVEVELNKEGLQGLADLVLGSRNNRRAGLDEVRGQLRDLSRISRGVSIRESKNFRAAYSILLKNVMNLQERLISTRESSSNRVQFNNFLKEMSVMSNSARFRRLLKNMESPKSRRNEAKLVFDPADLEGLDDEDFKEKLKGMTFGIEFGDEESPDAGAAETAIDVSAAPAPGAPPAPSEGYDDEDLEEEYDEYENENEIEEMYEDEDEEDEDEGEMEDEGEKTFHVDESMLRRELSRLREAKKGAVRSKGRGISNAMAGSFGGGKAGKHLVMQSKDTDLNVNEGDDEADGNEAVAKKALEVSKKAIKAAKSEREARVQEARMNRNLKAQLTETERVNVTLREQLEEVNLFNAKLLYVNKLMQNRDLTPRQQRAVVESLDAAKSVREAKLLYTSLTESLKTKTGNMNEGRVLGSSSRSTKSGSAVNESVEVDRWAILAGIK